MIKSYLEHQQNFIENWANSPEKEWEKSIFSKLKSGYLGTCIIF